MTLTEWRADAGLHKMNQELPERTNLTALTNDELLLIDAIVQLRGIWTQGLFADDYSLHMNTPYSHGLSDQDVPATIASLQDRGFIHEISEDGRGDEWEITDAGMSLWVQERRPLWDRYVSDSSSGCSSDSCEKETESGLALPVMCVCSPNPEMLEPFLQTMIDCGIYAPPRSSERVQLVEKDYYDFGKIFPEMHFLYVPLCKDDERRDMIGRIRDWSRYEPRRTWWRNIRELDSLRKKLNTI